MEMEEHLQVGDRNISASRAGNASPDHKKQRKGDSSGQDKGLLIFGGRVIDPSSGVDGLHDIIVRNGKVEAVQPARQWTADELGMYADTYDAGGTIVAPGLIDLHTHVYAHATPLGVDVDHYCLGRGVTTVVDAGSAGSATFRGLREFIAKRCNTRVLCFLHIAMEGLAWAGMAGAGGGGEIDNLSQVSVAEAERCIDDDRRILAESLIVGVKVRLEASVASNGANELEAFKRALLVCESKQLPLMVHHINSLVPLKRGDAEWADWEQKGGAESTLACPGSLRPGDIKTHCFHGWYSTIVCEEGEGETKRYRVRDDIKEARKRGVLFDVGHGAGAFSWTVAEACVADGLFPDTISTDMHMVSCDGPAYDLPTVASKLLALGMPLCDVIAAMTVKPAQAMGPRWAGHLGSLAPGREADICVLALEQGVLSVEDCHGQLRDLPQRLIAKAVWKAGVRYRITTGEALVVEEWQRGYQVCVPLPFPNPASSERGVKDLFKEKLRVRDSGWQRYCGCC